MKKKILSFAFMFALVAFALLFLAPTPAHAADTNVFYVKYGDVTYSVQSVTPTIVPANLYEALRMGTAVNAEGTTFSIPGLPEESQYMEFYDSETNTSTPATSTTALTISYGTTLTLQCCDMEIHDAETPITIDCSGFTADSTVEMLKGNIVKNENYRQYTIGLITLAFGDEELSNDMTFADLFARLSAGETLKMTFGDYSDGFFYLEISWTAMEAEFVYDPGEWNPEIHAWDNAHWMINCPEGSNTITVKNYSTSSVEVGAEFTPTDALEGLVITGDVKTTGSAKLESATGKSAAEISAVVFEISYAASGTREDLSLYPQEDTVGTVTITIVSHAYTPEPVGPNAGSTIVDSVDSNAVPAIAVSGELRLESIKRNVYSVEITWGSMEFTYTPKWNPDTHTYVHSDSGWSCEDGANKITVANHSSAPIKVDLEYTAYEDAVMGSLEVENGANQTLSAATAISGAPSITATLNISGALPSTVTERKAIGTVTVTITTQ
ncbi:MAG: hypothetical protein IJW76_03630 [Clostridia bacterium]|nr:hypothetical protein [Clostridia bacterium]